MEVRHDSFRNTQFVALARDFGVAIVIAGDAAYPQIGDVTAPFVYVRIMGTGEAEPAGYAAAALDTWAQRAVAWASGRSADGVDTVIPAKPAKARRDVFLYVISGCKVRNPAAAMALIARLKALGDR